jgi:archaellum biogenesis ATPase FlaH
VLKIDKILNILKKYNTKGRVKTVAAIDVFSIFIMKFFLVFTKNAMPLMAANESIKEILVTICGVRRMKREAINITNSLNLTFTSIMYAKLKTKKNITDLKTGILNPERAKKINRKHPTRINFNFK